MRSFRRLTSDNRGELWAFAIGLAVLLSIPSLGASSRLIHLAVVTLIWCIVAYGLYVSFGLFGQMTMAIAAIWGVSCFSVALAAIHWGWGFWACVPLGIAAGGAAGLLFALPSLRTHGHYFIVVTFAIAQLAVITGNNWEPVSKTRLGLLVPEYVQLGSIDFVVRANMLYLAACFLVVVFISMWLLKQSRFGKAAVAVRENETLAASLGINAPMYKLSGLAIGGAIAGCAGALQVFYIHSVQVDSFSLAQGIIVVEILVLGGARHIVGPLIGAAFVWLTPELIGLEPIQGQILFGAVLAVVICVFPEGIAGAVSWLRPGARRLLAPGRQGAATGPGEGSPLEPSELDPERVG